MKKVVNKENLYIVIGSVFVAIAINYIAVPSHLGEGGVTGLTMILHYVWGVPTYISNFVLNGVLIIIGWKILPRRMIIRTVYVICLTTLFLKLISPYQFNPQNSMIAAIFAGVAMGVGIGFIYLGNATSASSTLVAKMLQRYFGISPSTGVFICDLTVVLPSVAVLGLEKMLLTLINVYVGAKVIDFMVQGMNPRKAVFIISKEYETIAADLSKIFGRGITILDGSGYYSQENIHLLYMVIDSRQVLELSKIVNDVDEDAFLVINDVQNVFGNGFDTIMSGNPNKNNKNVKTHNFNHEIAS